MKNVGKRFAVLVFVLTAFLAWGSALSSGVWGCGGGGGDDESDSDSVDNPDSDSTDIDTETTLTCEGETSANLSAGGATAVIPEGQLDPCANASPALSLTATTATLDDGDVAISSGGNSVQLDLDGDFDTTTVPGDDEGEETDITIVLPYDDSAVGAGDEDSLHVYVLAEDQDTSAVVPLVGDLDTAANTITLSTKGLPENTIFTVVYNADMDAIPSDDPSIEALRLAPGKSLTSSTWPTNVWCVLFNSGNATLRSVVAGILGVTADSLTRAQIRAVLAERVSAKANTSGTEYQALGLRAPHLYLQPPTRATRVCSGSTSPIYIIHMVYGAGSSFFRPDDPQENYDTDTLAGFGTKFGRLYVEANRLDDAVTTPLGTVEATVAHEMFHAIQAGYEMFRSGERIRGVVEGTAATIGKTLDDTGTRTSEPQVRNFSSETFQLSTYLLNFKSGIRYSNADFFAYLARKYNSNSFGFLPAYFTAIKTRVSALISDADITAPPATTIYGSLADGITNGISASLDLPTVYFAFATDRLVEHSAKSQFGRTGETTTAGTLATGLLSRSSGLQSSLSGDPDSFNKRGTSNQMGSYSTRVFKVIPTSASSHANGRRLKVTVTPSTGTIGSGFRVKYYRAGSGSGTTASAQEFEVSNWGITTGDEIIVVVSNTQVASGATFTYAAVTEEETEAPSSSEELACAVGDAYCYFCSGPASGPVDATIPGVVTDYPQASIVIGWESETSLGNFDFELSDSTGAFIEATATMGDLTNVASTSVTRDSVSITLESVSESSALPVGSFGVESGASESIRTVTVTATFSGETAEIEVVADGWDGGHATASFTAAFQMSDSCSF